MQLRDAVAKYLELAGSFGKPVPLASFGMPREEAERFFSMLDEDYLISRFFHFRRDAGETFDINGFPHTHVMIDAEVQSIL